MSQHNWQAPLEADSPDWQQSMELHAQLLKAVRDKVAFDFQQAGKDALPGHAANAMGELTDKLCDLVSEYEDEIEQLSHSLTGGN